MRPYVKNVPSCIGYNLCYNLTLGQNLKFQKTCQNPFYKIISSRYVQKTARKNTKYSTNETILKTGHHLLKTIAFAKSLLWVKN